MEINDKTLDPINLIKNEFFAEVFKKTFEDLQAKRFNRPEPNPGVSYKRDWLDSLEDNNVLNSEMALREVKLILNRSSSLSLKSRNTLKAIYAISLEKFTEKMIKLGSNELPNKNRG